MAQKTYYTVSEFADLTGKTTQSIYKALQSGKLKGYGRKFNGVRKIRAEALELYREDSAETDPAADPEPAERVTIPESEIVSLLREQIAILQTALEHEKEIVRQQQEAMRQDRETLLHELEIIKAQIRVQYALQDKAGEVVEAPAADHGAEAPAALDPEPIRSEPADQNQQQRRPGILSRLFGRS